MNFEVSTKPNHSVPNILWNQFPVNEKPLVLTPNVSNNTIKSPRLGVIKLFMDLLR